MSCDEHSRGGPRVAQSGGRPCMPDCGFVGVRGERMLAGLVASLGGGLMWGLVFGVPLVLPDYPGVVLAFGPYIALGVLALAVMPGGLLRVQLAPA